MRAFHSIRWRLQFWHGLLLALVLAGFGIAVWQLFREGQFDRVDQELDRRLVAIIGATQRPPQGQRRLPVRNEPSFDGPARQQPELHLPVRDGSLFEGSGSGPFYYIAWLPDGRELTRSAFAPPGLKCPDRGETQRVWRLRGTMREYYHFAPPRGCVLVGRDITDTLAEIRRFAWLVAGAGGVVLALGLAGGWWISTRTLRPIADISTAAAKISAGDLSQRIRTVNTGSELADLVRVLNNTFARLQASFTRQAQFTADASHELRTPVTVLLTETQATLARERSLVEYRESLEVCQRAAQRMRRLTESLLVLARLDSGETAALHESCQLDRIAGEAIEVQRVLAEEKDVTLCLETNGPVWCMGNAEQLGLVVSNLVNNGIQYNCAGGRVAVEITAEHGAAALIVSDTGKGIAPEDLPHIFERFYRADKVRSTAAGYGLGLAITKAIVEAHMGTIHVTSEPDHGSRFEVRFPSPAP